MNAVEFTTELSANPVLPVPKEAAAQLPKSGTARVIVLTDDAELEWRQADHGQVLREEWSEAAARGLARAYGDNEPEYSQADIKP